MRITFLASHGSYGITYGAQHVAWHMADITVFHHQNELLQPTDLTLFISESAAPSSVRASLHVLNECYFMGCQSGVDPSPFPLVLEIK